MNLFSKLDKKYLKVSAYALGVIALSIILEKSLGNFGSVTSKISSVYNTFVKILSPFLYGFLFAYVINPIVSRFERTKVFIKIENVAGHKVKKNLAISLAYLVVLGCIVWIMAYFIPELIYNVKNLASNMSEYISVFEKTVQNLFDKIDFIDSEYILSLVNDFSDPAMQAIKDIAAKLPEIGVKRIMDSTVAAATFLINIFMGIVISIYMLSDKEKSKLRIKKILYAFLSQKKADAIVSTSERVNSVFKSFIVGKGLDSLIIGLICFIGMVIINAPYGILISVLIGVTNMIPYVGPFIGGIPAVAIVLLVSPSKAFIVAIFILLLQQFDGIILGPKILGDAISMDPIWVIFSIIIGGYIGGVLGMFLGVPIIASIRMFSSEYIDRKYNKKYFYNFPELKASSESPHEVPDDMNKFDEDGHK
ncbi:MAG: AI-2E family transporter [Lachnospiraceae bacterium]|nr:AI-2E family transporter [Lachnospiraceae bacterium]